MSSSIVSPKAFLLVVLGASATACASPDDAGSNGERLERRAPGHHGEAPEVCTYEYRPVCGSDHRTYSNACTARMAGTSVLHDQACSERDCAEVDGIVVEAERVDAEISCPDDRSEAGTVRTASSEASGADAICCVPG